MSSVSMAKCHLLNQLGHSAARQGWTLATDNPRAEFEVPSPAFILSDYPLLGFHVDTLPLDSFVDGQLIITPVHLFAEDDKHTRWTVKHGQRQAFSRPELALVFMAVNLKERLEQTQASIAAATATLRDAQFILGRQEVADMRNTLLQ